MNNVVRFFTGYAALIYLLLSLGALLAVRRIFRAWREGRNAVFGLEEEMSRRRLVQAAAVLLLIFALAVGESVLITFVAPSLPASALITTPTFDPLATSTIMFLANLETQQASAPTSMLITESTGCVPDQIMITSPTVGQTISGRIRLVGTADLPNFGFYKYEFAIQGTNIWTTIQAGRDPVLDDDLGGWDTTELTPGDYLLRLVVIDNQGTAVSPCVIPVRVINE